MNGTLHDVAQFFRKSERTVKRWIAETPPRIAYWKSAGSIVFGEEAIVEFAAAGYVAARRLQPGEACELARKEWREHMKRSAAAPTSELDALRRRVDLLEAKLNGLEAAVI